MGLTGKSRQRQFSSRAEGGPAPSIFVERDSWRQLPSGCFPYVAVLKTFGD